MNEHEAEMAQFHRDSQYYAAHWEELLAQYPEQWVAIYNEQVVGTSTNFKQLLIDLKEAGIPAGWTVITNPAMEQEVLITTLALPVPETPHPIPSLLGRDVLSHFALFLEERTGRVLLLEPHEAAALPL